MPPYEDNPVWRVRDRKVWEIQIGRAEIVIADTPGGWYLSAPFYGPEYNFTKLAATTLETAKQEALSILAWWSEANGRELRRAIATLSGS